MVSNVGIVGYGLAAKTFHIPFIAQVPELKLYAIVQRSPKPDEDAEKDHPGIKSYRSTEELVRDDGIDVVVITTTPETHFELTKLVLESGKHVVVEKPFTPTAKEASDLIDLAKKHSRLLTVYQNRRFDADFLTLSSLLASHTLGRVAEFETHFDRHRPTIPPASTWKTKPIPGGGAIYDLGTHLLDQVVCLFGPPQRITGFVGAQREGETGGYEDSFTVLLHYHDGMLATAKAGVVSPEKEQLRFWARGTAGSYKKFHLDIQESQLRSGLTPRSADFGVEPATRHGTLTVADGESMHQRTLPTLPPKTYAEFYRLLAGALDGRGEVPVRPEDAMHVIELVELARSSSRQGRTLDVVARYST